MLPRGGGEDGEAPVLIPKGSLITLNLFALHHREDLYGDDVEEFRPERWEGRERRLDMIAFGGGPRSCIGREYSSAIHMSCTKSYIGRTIRHDYGVLCDCTNGSAV